MLMVRVKSDNMLSTQKHSLMQSGFKWLWLTLLFFIVDQYTKQLIVENFAEREVLDIFPMFNLTLAYNRGAAFSFLANQDGWQVLFFTTISSVVSLVLLWWLYTLNAKKDWWLSISLSLILGGAIGNLYDRVTLEKVVDFLDFYYGSYHFPAFNVADSVIFLGAAMMIYDSFVLEPNKLKKEKSAEIKKPAED